LQDGWIDVLFVPFTDRSQRAFETLSKTRVAKVQNRDPALKSVWPALSRLLADEQARWLGFSPQLEELERRITPPRR
jgi:hypothetical protein